MLSKTAQQLDKQPCNRCHDKICVPIMEKPVSVVDVVKIFFGNGEISLIVGEN